MKHTLEALETARPYDGFTGWNLDSEALEREWAGIGIVPVAQTRDSEALERANFDTALAELSALHGEDNVGIVRFGHWACGWVELAIFNTGVSGLEDSVESIKQRLDNYPVLDEELWLEYEWADNHPEADNYCYSEDYDFCECGRPKA